MKKGIILLLGILAINTAKGQAYYKETGFLLGANVAYNFVTGDFKEINKNSFGFNLSGKYLINRVLGIGIEAGYYPYRSKISGNQNVNQTMKNRVIPLLLETTFYIPTWDRSLLPYLGIHFGGYITHIKISQSGSNYGDPRFSRKINRFSVGGGPHVGLLIELSEYFKLDLKVRGDFVPDVKSTYTLDELQTGNIGFNKIITIGASVGLLYTF